MKKYSSVIFKRVLATLLVVCMVTMSAFAVTLLPTGGGEPDYEGASYGDCEDYLNCYFYAVMQACSSSTDLATMQPGYLSDSTFERLNVTDIIAAANRDLGRFRSITATTENTRPTSSQRKVALVIAPDIGDYHWYMQNSDGYWSHKRGLTEVTNLDASGNLISNPRTCDRTYTADVTNWYGTYELTLDYSTFCGYYTIG